MAITLLGVTTLAELKRRVAQNPYGFAEEVWTLMEELRTLKYRTRELEEAMTTLTTIKRDVEEYLCPPTK
jgi:hypothetical protein